MAEGCVSANLTAPVEEFPAAAARHFPGIPERALLRLLEEAIRGGLENAAVRSRVEHDLLAAYFTALRSSDPRSAAPGCGALPADPAGAGFHRRSPRPSDPPRGRRDGDRAVGTRDGEPVQGPHRGESGRLPAPPAAARRAAEAVGRGARRSDGEDGGAGNGVPAPRAFRRGVSGAVRRKPAGDAVEVLERKGNRSLLDFHFTSSISGSTHERSK